MKDGTPLLLLLLAITLAAFAMAPLESPAAPAAQPVRTWRPDPPMPAAAAAAPGPAVTFGGYPCDAPGCPGHKAGYRWAAQLAVTDADDCTGLTASFIEGCRVYADQRAAANAAASAAASDALTLR